MTQSQFFVGVDGGGTKTAYLLVDGTGKIVASHTGPGCNPSSVGEGRATELVHDGIRQLLQEEHIDPKQIGRLLLCMAGSRIFWRKMLQENPPLPGVPSRAVGDHYPVLELGTKGEPGIVLHAGTGSFIVARDPKGEVRIGGAIGYLLGDPGSGFELGRLAIQKVSLQTQGLGERGPLWDLVTEKFQFTDMEGMVREVYHRASFVADAAALAPDIIRLATEGDRNCRDIIEEAVAPFLRWASMMMKATELEKLPSYKAAISGAILRSPVVQEFARPYWRSLGHEWNFVEINGSPAEGVASIVARE
jgi:glucosamine kinase